jgi:hypothetical protein
MANQITRPLNRKEFMSKLEVPYVTTTSGPNEVFSEPQKLGQPEHNRALETTLRGDTDKDFAIGIKDFDEAVKYYFDNVLKLSVLQNNTDVQVPVLYGNQENWKDIQLEGYLRDRNGKMMAPMLFFRRTGLTQNTSLGFKLDGNQAHNLQYFESRYTKRNVYSNFNVLNSRNPEKKYIVSVTPDYVTVEYSCVVWTYFVEQMDKLIEALNFASRSYWGDKNRFLFYVSIDSFQENLEYSLGTDRAVRNEFKITLNGYLIPDSINKKMAAANRTFGVANLVFGLETATSSEQTVLNINKPKARSLASIAANDSVNVTVGQGGQSSLDPATTTYLVSVKQVQGSYISSNTVIYYKSWAIPPIGLPANSVSNFTFFVNSALIDPNAITSFTDNDDGTSTLVVNTTTLGFSFDSTDILYAIGKFA